MILSADFINYESYKEAHVEFCPGVNVIVGTSDEGKSGLMRGLFWTFFDKPKGDGGRSDWGGTTKVGVNFDDGELSRIKSSSYNGYILNGQEHKGVIGGPIIDFLNLHSLNFQQQGDPLFLLDMNSGERGRYLNDMVNLNIIDTATSNIKSIAAEETSVMKHIQTDIEQIEKVIKGFDYLDDLGPKLVQVEKQQGILDYLNEETDSIENLLSRIDNVEEARANIPELENGPERILKLEKLDKDIDIMDLEIDALGDLIEGIISFSTQIDLLEDIIKNNQVKFRAAMPKICPLCGD